MLTRVRPATKNKVNAKESLGGEMWQTVATRKDCGRVGFFFSLVAQHTVCVASSLPRTMYLAPTADPPHSPMPARSRGCL